jgi:hypothetical protein
MGGRPGLGLLPGGTLDGAAVSGVKRENLQSF